MNYFSVGSYYLSLKKITIAGWLVDVMARQYGDTAVALVPNSVDTQIFHAPKNPAGLPQRLDLCTRATYTRA